MSLELFVLITLAYLIICIVLFRSRLNLIISLSLIVLPFVALITLIYFYDFPRLFIQIWSGVPLLVVGLFWFRLLKMNKPMRRYPGALSKYRSNSNLRKWSSTDIQNYQSTYLAGTDESNKALLEVVEADMKAVGNVFLPYVDGMKGGSKFAVYIVPNEYSFWATQDKKGIWWRIPNKSAAFTKATSTVLPSEDYENEQKVLVGYFYVK